MTNKPIDALSLWLSESSCSFAFVNSTPNIFYLTGFYCDPHERLLGLLVFPGNDPVLVCPGLEVSRARNDGWQGDIIEYSDLQNPWDFIADMVKTRASDEKVVAIEKDFLPVGRSEALKQILPGLQFVSLEDKLVEMRNIKGPDEIKLMREAGRFADKAIEVAVGSLREGVTEAEVAAKLEYEMRKVGISRMAFSTIVLFGARSAISHGVPSNVSLKPGDLVLIDMGVVCGGYCSDITRTFAYKSVSPDLEEMYDITLKAQAEAIKACQPGNPISAVDRGARDVITKAGYGENTGMRVGHGIGIEIHEYPSVSGMNQDLLYEGMVFTVEPGIYFDDKGGVRIEDDILITREGYESFTSYPKKLQIID